MQLDGGWDTTLVLSAKNPKVYDEKSAEVKFRSKLSKISGLKGPRPEIMFWGKLEGVYEVTTDILASKAIPMTTPMRT